MARTRTKVDLPNQYEYYFIDYSVGGSDSQSGPFLVAYDNQTMIDTLTPNFKVRSKKGETIINPMSLTRSSRDSIGDGYESSQTWNTSGVVTSAFEGSGNTTLVMEPTIVYKKSTLGHAGLIRDAQLMAISGIDSTPLSSGEDLLELRETINFLKSPIKGILKEARKRNISRFVDVPAASWLTYRMAFAPLVRSVHDILSEIKQPTKAPADIRVSHGRAVDSDKVTDSPKKPNSLGGFHNFSSVHQVDLTAHSFIRYRLKTATHDWRWRYGLRNKDIPASYWAVVPLSFMVDRVFDVSSLIQAVTNLADPNVQILGSGITLKRTDVFSRQHTGSTINSTAFPRVSYDAKGPQVIDITFTMSRNKLSPQLKHIVPRIKPKGLIADFNKTTDFAALLRMFTRK